MTKIIKIASKVLFSILEYVLIIGIFSAFIIRTDFIQTELARIATNQFSQKIGSPVAIGKVSIDFFDQATIQDILILDKREDTLIYINKLSVNVEDFSINNWVFELNDFNIDNAVVKLKKHEKESVFNYQFILDSFKNQNKDSDNQFSISVEKMNLSNLNLEIHDYNEKKQPKGIDFSHLHLKQIISQIEDISINSEEVSAIIRKLNFRENSGFHVENLISQINFSLKGIFFKDTEIDLLNSKLVFGKSGFETSSQNNFTDFADSVQWNLKLSKSRISLKDVAYFVPQIWGMDQQLSIEGKISNYLSNLSLDSIRLDFGNQTYLKGNIKLPDFRSKEKFALNNVLTEYHIDLNEIDTIKLPDTQGEPNFFILPTELSRIGYLKGSNLKITSIPESTICEIGRIQTEIGNIQFQSPIEINKDTLDVASLKFSEQPENGILFEKFDFGHLLSINDLGTATGKLTFDQADFITDEIRINSVTGLIKELNLFNYPYSNVMLENFDLELKLKELNHSVLKGSLKINDPNLIVSGKTYLEDFNEIKIQSNIDIHHANLTALHASLNQRGQLSTSIKLDCQLPQNGLPQGLLEISNLRYEELDTSFKINQLNLTSISKGLNNQIELKSDILDFNIEGSFEIEHVFQNIEFQIAQIFPVFFEQNKKWVNHSNQFNYALDVKDINPILNIFYPSLHIPKQLSMSGEYSGINKSFSLSLNGDNVGWEGYNLSTISLFHELQEDQLLALYDIGEVYIKDTLALKNIHFTTIAQDGFTDANIQFEDASAFRSNIDWQTTFPYDDAVNIVIMPSTYLTYNNHRWDISDQAELNYSGSCMNVEKLELKRNNQVIQINGQLSNHPNDQLSLFAYNLDLEDVGDLFLDDINLKGSAFIDGYISDPFVDIGFNGTAMIKKFYVNQREIGEVYFNAKLDSYSEKIELNGELINNHKRTFNFDGDYYFQRKDHSLNLDLIFNGTDISFANAFIDSSVVSQINGELEGKYKLSGTINEPQFDGSITLNNGQAKVGLLGTKYSFNGNIESDSFGFLIDRMPIKDEEGNTGYLTGVVTHDYFQNFVYDVFINLDQHDGNASNPQFSNQVHLDKFLVLNTLYEEGSIYYGKAYVTGTINISGYNENLSIVADIKTNRGTWIDFPMYGSTSVSEDGFITFLSPDSDQIKTDQLNFSGVDLDLNFDITSDARIKLIFDPDIGDEITTLGNGLINLGIDKYGEVTMEGAYTLTDGKYNFALGPYKQDFYITPGGTIQWIGSPYEAQLDVRTYYKTVANLSAVMPDVIESKESDNEEIYSYLILTGDMNQPEISFDLEAPKASEAGKAVLNRIKSDQDELNRQFFSIMIIKRFLPLAGQETRGGAGGNAIVDLVSTQINSILAKVSDDYKMKVDIDSDDLTGEGSVEFGVSKGFFDDKLIVSTSLGVANSGSSNQGSLIGDFSIEYVLNEEGTFRVNAFNESNTNTVLQENQSNPFTQGIGINYKEEFHTIQDFKLIQAIFDVFRKKNARRVLGKKKVRKYSPIPRNSNQISAIKEEE